MERAQGCLTQAVGEYIINVGRTARRRLCAAYAEPNFGRELYTMQRSTSGRPS